MEQKGEKKKTKTLDILVETYKLMLEEAKRVGEHAYRTENVEPFRELKKAEEEIKDRLKKSFEAELKKPAVVIEGKVMDEYNSWFRRAESEMREELLERVREEIKKPPVPMGLTYMKSITQPCKTENRGRPNRSIYPDGELKAVAKEYIHDAPTWALIEELKNRPGVTFRANTTKDGLVGTFEHAPAMVFTVKLPLEK